jgi:hypothetical protein
MMGSVVHQALEVYYKNYDKPFMERAELALDTAGESLKATTLDSKSGETVIRTLGEYLKYRKDDRLIPKEVEVPFATTLYEGKDLQGEDIQILYEGKIDLIAEENNETIVIDHKTTSINTSLVDLKVQFLGYHWATGLKVVVNRIGFQSSLKPEEKFKRYPLRFEKRVVQDFEKFLISKSLELALYLDRKEFPQNFAACDSAYGECTYAEICRYPTLQEETIKFNYVEAEPWDVFNMKG